MDTTENDPSTTETPSREDAAIAGAEAEAEAEAGRDHEADPDAGGERRPTVTPAEAHARIARGEPVEGVRVVGLVLKGTFDRPVLLRRVTLIRPVIEHADFRAEVVFDHCTLDRARIGPRATFAAGLDLRSSSMVKPSLRALVVRGTLRLDGAHVRGLFQMMDCTFEGRVRCWNAKFGGWIKLDRCVFENDADFRSIHAEEGLVLEACVFNGPALFRGATCVKKWDAAGSTFLGLLDLSRAKLHDFVYLEAMVQGPSQRFAFHNALAERLLVRTEQLVGRIASEEKGDHARAMEEYGLLKRAFEGLHRYDQQDWAFYRFKVNQRRRTARTWSRPWTKLAQLGDWLLLDLGCGYGTNPLRAVRAAALIMLAFGLIYVAGAHALYVEKLPFQSRGIDYPPNRLIVGLLTSVSVFTSGFGSLRDTAQGWMNLPLILESLLGTFLWGLFIVAFSRKVIR